MPLPLQKECCSISCVQVALQKSYQAHKMPACTTCLKGIQNVKIVINYPENECFNTITRTDMPVCGCLSPPPPGLSLLLSHVLHIELCKCIVFWILLWVSHAFAYSLRYCSYRHCLNTICIYHAGVFTCCCWIPLTGSLY